MAAGELWYSASAGALYYRDSSNVARMVPYDAYLGSNPISTVPAVSEGKIVAGNFGQGDLSSRRYALAYSTSWTWRYVLFYTPSGSNTTKPTGAIRVSGTYLQMFWGSHWGQALAS